VRKPWGGFFLFEEQVLGRLLKQSVSKVMYLHTSSSTYWLCIAIIQVCLLKYFHVNFYLMCPGHYTDIQVGILTLSHVNSGPSPRLICSPCIHSCHICADFQHNVCNGSVCVGPLSMTGMKIYCLVLLQVVIVAGCNMYLIL
jgi:hypothetical protein